MGVRSKFRDTWQKSLLLNIYKSQDSSTSFSFDKTMAVFKLGLLAIPIFIAAVFTAFAGVGSFLMGKVTGKSMSSSLSKPGFSNQFGVGKRASLGRSLTSQVNVSLAAVFAVANEIAKDKAGGEVAKKFSTVDKKLNPSIDEKINLLKSNLKSIQVSGKPIIKGDEYSRANSLFKEVNSAIPQLIEMLEGMNSTSIVGKFHGMLQETVKTNIDQVFTSIINNLENSSPTVNDLVLMKDFLQQETGKIKDSLGEIDTAIRSASKDRRTSFVDNETRSLNEAEVAIVQSLADLQLSVFDNKIALQKNADNTTGIKEGRNPYKGKSMTNLDKGRIKAAITTGSQTALKAVVRMQARQDTNKANSPGILTAGDKGSSAFKAYLRNFNYATKDAKGGSVSNTAESKDNDSTQSLSK